MVVREFIDPGYSGTSLNRPGMQAMLRYLEEEAEQVDYLVVHKLDRLARNRADEVTLTTRLNELGIRLVSTTENIDQTPGGLPVQGIMSAFSEFYSKNLANEVLKGMSEKVRNGGSVGRAPIGYLNHRIMSHGREIRTVIVDENRAPLVTWAFEAHSTGNHTMKSLAAELKKRGLTTVPTRKMAEREVQERQIHGMLTNPFYIGIVTFKVVQYPGRHTPIIDKTTFEKVQLVLQSKLTGERSRKHDHYLKSTLFCGHCTSRLLMQKVRSGSTGELYDYFSCAGRHAKRTDCNFRSVQIAEIEKGIQRIYERISLDPALRADLEAMLKAVMKHLRRQEDEEREQLETAKLQIERKQHKLLEAHYSDTIPLEMLRSEQQRLDAELQVVTRKLAAHVTNVTETNDLITMALTLCENIANSYRQAPEHIRRAFNQLIFERIDVHYDEDEGTYEFQPEYTEAFAFLGHHGIRATVDQFIKQNKKPAETDGLNDNTWDESLTYAIGFSKSLVVDLRGIEPLTFSLRTRRATNCATDPDSDQL